MQFKQGSEIMDAVTVVISTQPTRVAKVYSKENGVITKEAIGDISEGTAYTKIVSNAHEMAELLAKVTDREDAVVCPGVWRNSKADSPFRIVTEKQLAKIFNSQVGKVDGGVLDNDGEQIAARLKRGIMPSNWILLDADNPPGIPSAWAKMTIEQRLMFWEPMVPGISQCERIELRASSARVMNGSGSKQKTHAWIRVNDASKVPLLKAFIGVEMVNKGLSFRFEKKSRIDRSKTVGVEARSVFDLSVFDTGRLVFCSKPILGLGMDEYTVDDAGIEIINEGFGPLDISWVSVPSKAAVDEYKKSTGVDLKIKSENGHLSVDSYGQLTMQTEIERRGEVKTLEEWIKQVPVGETLRCESPFRESHSEAAFISHHSNGNVVVHDVGNGTTYKLGQPDSLRQSFDYCTKSIRPIEYCVDGFISNKVTVIAGPPGVGKTSLLVPLACVAAGLIGASELSATLRRRVSYVTEDKEQVERILFGMRKHGVINASDEEIRYWFEIVPAIRANAAKVGQFIRNTCDEMTVTAPKHQNCYQVEPLIVLDTSNATIDMDNENDNAEAGKAISAIKENLGNASLWLVAHTSKVASRIDVKSMSARGAGAFEGDANAVAYILNVETKRFMTLGKRRFEAAFDEICFESHTAFEDVQTPWGERQRVWYRYGLPRVAEEGERDDLLEQAKKDASIEVRDNLRGKILGALLEAGKTNRMVSQIELHKIVGGKKKIMVETLDAMLANKSIYVRKGDRNATMYSVSPEGTTGNN
jgi:hypothetical protein